MQGSHISENVVVVLMLEQCVNSHVGSKLTLVFHYYSGPGGQKNIFENKYGQRLAAIQIARQQVGFRPQTTLILNTQ